MNEARVDRLNLLEVIKKNRAKHKEIVDDVFTNYRKRVIEELDKALVLAKSGKQLITNIQLIQPMDMTETYDRAIGMLEMCLDESVSLDTDEYDNYVLDKWDWSRQFSSSSASYSSSSCSSSR